MECYVPEFTLEGSAREIGFLHGKYLTSKIEQNVQFYKKLFGRSDEWISEYCEKVRNRLKETVPEILEEIEGISEGSGINLTWILALNSRTEIYTTTLNEDKNKKKSAGSECTLLSLPKIGILSQTWDWYDALQSTTATLRINRTGRPRIIAYTEAGIVAKIGMNEQGIGVCLNFLDCLEVLNPTLSIPVHVLIRKALDCNSVSEWNEWFSSLLPHGPQTSSALTIYFGDQKKLISYELMNCKWFEIVDSLSIYPEDNNNYQVFYRTNHYLTKETDTSHFSPSKSSLSRYERCHELVQLKTLSFPNTTNDDILKLLVDERVGVQFNPVKSLAHLGTIKHGTIVVIIMNLIDKKMYISLEKESLTSPLTLKTFSKL